MRLRQSEVKDFITCMRSWFLNYWLNPNERGQSEVPEFPGAAELGSLVHAALHAITVQGQSAAYGTGQWLGENMSWPDQIPEEWLTAARDAEFYAERYVSWLESQGLDVGVSLVGHELELEAEVPGTGVVIYGSIDRLDVSVQTGLNVQDYKTGKQFRNLMANDFQMLTYAWLVRACGYGTPSRGTYARIKTVKTTKTGEPQDHVHIVINDEMLDQHEDHLISIVEDIKSVVHLLDQGMDPVKIRPTTSNDCSWRCDALAACGAMSTGDYWEDVLPYPKGPSPGYNQRGSTS